MATTTTHVSVFDRLAVSLQRAASYAGYAVEMAAPLLRFWDSGSARSRQVTVDGLQVRCDYGLPASAPLLADWEQLYRTTPSATPFQSPAWQQALLDAPQVLNRLRLFSIHDGSRLIGVLPLESRLGGVLRTSGSILTDYLDPLIDPNYGEVFWRTALRGIRELSPPKSLILENVREDACENCNLDECAKASGFTIAKSSHCTVARIPLPATWDAYLKSLDSHERKELKRKINKAETQGGARLDVCRDPATILREMDQMFKLFHTCGGGKALKAKWLFPRHFASSAPSLVQSGRLVLYKLVIENRLAAGMIALPTHRGQILWNTAFDPTMKQWSPGIVLFGMLIRSGIEQKHQVLDLLRGQYDYKYRLGAKDHPLRTVTLKPAK